MTDPEFTQLTNRVKYCRAAVDEAKTKLVKAEQALEAWRRRQPWTCANCNTETPIGELTVVREFFGGYRPCGEDDHRYQERHWVCCPVCRLATDSYACEEPQRGMIRARPAVDWYSEDDQDGSGYALMQPTMRRQREQMGEQIRERRLEQARRLLREAGELP